jgi:hypothetical protein
MLELVILACLAKTPAHCEEFPVPFYAPQSAMQCMIDASLHAAEWTRDHPDWVIRRWHCDSPRA